VQGDHEQRPERFRSGCSADSLRSSLITSACSPQDRRACSQSSTTANRASSSAATSASPPPHNVTFVNGSPCHNPQRLSEPFGGDGVLLLLRRPPAVVHQVF
jgi:hypothetical protein